MSDDRPIEQQLRERGAAPVLFISDPTEGDQFVFGSLLKLTRHPVPATADGSEISTGEDLADRLDLGLYEEPPRVTRV